MRCAIFTATGQGVVLARRLRDCLDDEIVIFSKKGLAEGKDLRFYTKLSHIMRDIFRQYDALLFVMAAGIAVRMIAPHLESKLLDPAVLVLDDRAEHVISLLSGHIGGANELTRQVAAILGAEPVITTATDVHGKLAPDRVAARFALRPWPKENIQVLNRALLQGQEVRYFLDTGLQRAEFYEAGLQELGLVVESHEASGLFRVQTPFVYITSRTMLPIREGVLYLQPRCLIAGIGCRRGTSREELYAALREACARIGREPVDVGLLASTVWKQKEPGLLELGRVLQREVRFWENDVLQRVITEYGLRESAFVKQTIGIGNVAESAALACVTGGRIALGKTKFSKVTVALIWEK